MDTIEYPLVIQQGADLNEIFEFRDGPYPTSPLANLTGVEAQAQIRDKEGGTLFIDLVVTVDAQVVDDVVTVARVYVKLPASSTDDMVFTDTKHWDIFLRWTDTGYTIKPFKGPVTLEKRVTEWDV